MLEEGEGCGGDKENGDLMVRDEDKGRKREKSKLQQCRKGYV